MTPLTTGDGFETNMTCSDVYRDQIVGVEPLWLEAHDSNNFEIWTDSSVIINGLTTPNYIDDCYPDSFKSSYGHIGRSWGSFGM